MLAWCLPLSGRLSCRPSLDWDQNWLISAPTLWRAVNRRRPTRSSGRRHCRDQDKDTELKSRLTAPISKPPFYRPPSSHWPLSAELSTPLNPSNSNGYRVVWTVSRGSSRMLITAHTEESQLNRECNSRQSSRMIDDEFSINQYPSWRHKDAG